MVFDELSCTRKNSSKTLQLEFFVCFLVTSMTLKSLIRQTGVQVEWLIHYPTPALVLRISTQFRERLIFKYVYNHFLENNILTSFQSGFRRGDSTVNQLSYLYNTFCQALDAGKEVRAIFCDISKAFDRVWHAGLIHKLKSAGISGNLFIMVYQLPTWSKAKGCYVWCSVCLEFYLSWGTSGLFTWSTSLPSFYERYCSRHWIIYTSFCKMIQVYISL